MHPPRLTNVSTEDRCEWLRPHSRLLSWGSLVDSKLGVDDHDRKGKCIRVHCQYAPQTESLCIGHCEMRVPWSRQGYYGSIHLEKIQLETSNSEARSMVWRSILGDSLCSVQGDQKVWWGHIFCVNLSGSFAGIQASQSRETPNSQLL